MDAAILITTSLQRIANTKAQKQPPATPDWLIMSIAVTPSSNYLKNKKGKKD
jgi:hypothetical protein